MGYKAAAQVLKKADHLKAKMITKHQNLLNDLQAWTDQQQLQTIYHQVLVLDLEFALDKKVEQDLWTLGFKNHISILQEQTRDKKNPRRSESQGLLSWCLEAASGFYLTLLQELCSTYELDLPFRSCGTLFDKLRTCAELPNSTPQSSSCIYICQYCLVHLGDIARYRNQRQQAESFYKHAILVSPYSGHPYNQLALLEASQGDKLATVFQYVRGIAVKNPFPAAIANLTKTLSTAMDKEQTIQEIQTKMSVNEFINMFLKIHSLLHTKCELKQAEVCLKSINGALTALVATQSFTQHQLIMMTIINMFALHHAGDGELTQEEKTTWRIILALLAGSLSAFLLPVYTLKNDATILEYSALPAIRLLLIWIKTKPELLNEVEFASRLQIWPGYCKLLNIMREHVDSMYNSDNFSTKPLFYDKEFQGFIPLQTAFNDLKFRETPLESEEEKHIQAWRLIEIGKWLTTLDLNGSKLIISKHVDNILVFEPACIQPDPTGKLLEEMKSFTIADRIEDPTWKGLERKAGILKPQGSLEKSREERNKISQEEAANAATTVPKFDNSKMKRVTQNVALQSIYKKLEENKQVKFSTDADDKSQQIMKPKQNIPPIANNNQQFRTQTFNQSHPGLLNNEKEFYNYAPPPKIPMPPQSNAGFVQMDNAQFQKSLEVPNFPPPSMPPHMANKNMFQHPPPSAPMNFGNLMDHSYGVPFPREDRGSNWWMQGTSQGSMQQHPGSVAPPQSYTKHVFNPINYGPMPPNQQELFSPWGTRNPNTNQNNSMGLGASGLSMRQVMLNESNQHIGATADNIPGSNQANNSNAPGYSLFNTTSWSPTLPQLRNLNPDMRQQSLFTSSVPQSLQQLLEQQNQMQKGDT